MNFVMDTVIPTLAMYTADFSKKYEGHTDVAAREFAERLVLNNITKRMGQMGCERIKIKAGKQTVWCPNPEEFAKMCLPQPEDLGIPTLDEAIREIVEARSPSRYGATKPYEFSHRVVELVNKRVGYDVHLLTTDEFKKKAKGEYDHWVKMAMENKLPEPRTAIAHKQEPDLPEHLKGPAKVDLSWDIGRRMKERFDANGTPYIIVNPGA